MVIIGSRLEKSPGVLVISAAIHDLSLIDDRLGVVALHVAEVRFHPLAVRVIHADHIVG
jgi:hypothetical protein